MISPYHVIKVSCYQLNKLLSWIWIVYFCSIGKLPIPSLFTPTVWYVPVWFILFLNYYRTASIRQSLITSVRWTRNAIVTTNHPFLMVMSWSVAEWRRRLRHPNRPWRNGLLTPFYKYPPRISPLLWQSQPDDRRSSSTFTRSRKCSWSSFSLTWRSGPISKTNWLSA